MTVNSGGKGNSKHNKSPVNRHGPKRGTRKAVVPKEQGQAPSEEEVDALLEAIEQRKDAKHRRALMDRAEIQRHMLALQRGPFVEVLTDLLEQQPTPVALAQFADRNPDAWMKAVMLAARLSGFHEKLEVDHSHTLHVQRMSDQELFSALRERLGDDAARILDITPDSTTARLLAPTIDATSEGGPATVRSSGPAYGEKEKYRDLKEKAQDD